ncbi:hypothetical protein [Paraburkholderia humisilvae]|uniref:Uncharacterized protein n=1 Tax=Paraburkholderia humisilvae TaxID=627669 RepID=A0A6J5F9M6_9BURK|nr:hypothetical protein [Paraburkholderia humisilvae]CAB3775184.1 hypothetical protein LMG29542_08566 [Paraburkholderia humisilvae]
MAIFVPAPPAERSRRAKSEWQRYAADLRTLLEGQLRPGELSAVRFQLRFAETLLDRMQEWEPVGHASTMLRR